MPYYSGRYDDSDMNAWSEESEASDQQSDTEMDEDASNGSEDDSNGSEDASNGSEDTDNNASSTNSVLSESSNDLAGVYVLKSHTTGVSYVGKSLNVANRINEHRRQNINDVLTRETTVTLGSALDLESWERNEVLTRMYLDGMESVRGWRYTRRGRLTTDEKVAARNDIMEKFDLCRRCGRNSHFADKCFARSAAFWCKDIPM
jgi:hypothetical protein